MKENKSNEEPATSIIRRLDEKRRLLEKDYNIIDKNKFRTAQDRRINNFTEERKEEKSNG